MFIYAFNTIPAPKSHCSFQKGFKVDCHPSCGKTRGVSCSSAFFHKALCPQAGLLLLISLNQEPKPVLWRWVPLFPSRTGLKYLVGTVAGLCSPLHLVLHSEEKQFLSISSELKTHIYKTSD